MIVWEYVELTSDMVVETLSLQSFLEGGNEYIPYPIPFEFGDTTIVYFGDMQEVLYA